MRKILFVIFMVIIIPVYSQEITSFDTKSIDLQDISMPKPLTCFSIMELLDIPYIQYLIATRKMKQGTDNKWKNCETYITDDLLEHIPTDHDYLVRKSHKKCKKCRNRILTVYYNGYYDDAQTLGNGGSFHICSQCFEKENLTHVRYRVEPINDR